MVVQVWCSVSGRPVGPRWGGFEIGPNPRCWSNLSSLWGVLWWPRNGFWQCTTWGRTLAPSFCGSKRNHHLQAPNQRAAPPARPRPPMPSSWRPAGTGGSGTCRGQALHAVGPGRVVLGLSAADNEVVLAGPVAFPFSWAASGLVVEAVGRASAAQGGGASVRGGRMHQLPAQRGAHDHHWSSMSPRKPATPAADHQFEAVQESTAARPPGEGAAAVTERPDRPSSLGVARGEVVELDSTSSGLVACCASPQGSFLHSARMKGARARVCRGSARRATPSHAAGVPGALWRADCSAACAAARRLAEP